MSEFSISAGSHIKVKRWKGFYTHHGIADGKGNVIHFRWDPDKRAGVITVDRFNVFSKGSKFDVITSATPPELVLKNANSRLGETGYNLITNNCEHFTEWCTNGNKKSYQTRKAIGIFSTIATFFLFTNLPIF